MAADRAALPDGLLADVKNWLDITWDDEATDAKMSGLIASGMAYLDGKLGEAGNYTGDGLPRTLLLEYCRYGRDSALDGFENNYRPLLLAMQHETRVRAFELENAAPA